MNKSNGIEWQLNGVTARLVVTRRNRSSVKIDVFMMSKPFEDGWNTFAQVCVGLSLSEVISMSGFQVTVPATIEKKKGTSYRWLSARPQYLQCVSNGDTAVLYCAIGIYYVKIGSDNGLSPFRRQAIITWTKASLLPIRPSGINFSEILIKSQISSFNKICLKRSSACYIVSA